MNNQAFVESPFRYQEQVVPTSMDTHAEEPGARYICSEDGPSSTLDEKNTTSLLDDSVGQAENEIAEYWEDSHGFFHLVENDSLTSTSSLTPALENGSTQDTAQVANLDFAPDVTDPLCEPDRDEQTTDDADPKRSGVMKGLRNASLGTAAFVALASTTFLKAVKDSDDVVDPSMVDGSTTDVVLTGESASEATHGAEALILAHDGGSSQAVAAAVCVPPPPPVAEFQAVAQQMAVQAANNAASAAANTATAAASSSAGAGAGTSVGVATGVSVAVAAAIAAAISSAVVTQDSQTICDVPNAHERSGSFFVSLKGLTRHVNATELEFMENLFSDTYNNISGGCDDVFQRFALNVSLSRQDVVLGPNEDNLLETIWNMDVSCNDCPLSEPLFADILIGDFDGNITSTEGTVHDNFTLNHSFATSAPAATSNLIDDDSSSVDQATKRENIFRLESSQRRLQPDEAVTSVDQELFFEMCNRGLIAGRDMGFLEPRFEQIAVASILDYRGSRTIVMQPAPTATPSSSPSLSMSPSVEPSSIPSTSMSPSVDPSSFPSQSAAPSFLPSALPSQSLSPSKMPSSSPTSIVYGEIRSNALFKNLCIEVPDTRAVNGNALVLNPCVAGENQLWHWDNDGMIRSKLNFEKCLTAVGARIAIFDCFRKKSQRWTWAPTGQIHLLFNPTRCIDGDFRGQPVHTYKCESTNDQIWL